MARMLGEKLLPEAVQSRRRMLRERLMDVRDPVRRRRQEMVPGPDIIGTAERNLAQMRNKVVNRDGVLPRLRGGSGGGGPSSGSSSNSSNSGSSSSNSTTQMT